MYGEKGASIEDAIQHEIDQAAKDGRTIDREEALEEVVANSMESMLADGKVIEQLVREKPNLARRIWQKLKELVAKLTKRYDALDPDSPEGRQVKEWADEAAKLRDMFAAALSSAREGYAKAGVGEASEFVDTTTGEDVKYSIREKDPPKNTMTGYKVFFVKDGKLYPPMVANPGGADTPVGVWLDADVGTQAPDSKTGRKQVRAGGKGTQGGGGSLAFRPGWHLGEIPLATQFDRVNPETGKKELFPEQFVWAECEIAADKNYQDEAMSYGYTKNGKFQHSLAGLPRVPVDGYYQYRTNPNPDTVPWLITGAMKVNRLLSDAEVNAILRENGLPEKHRVGGDKTLADLGLGNARANTVVSDEFVEQTKKKFGITKLNDYVHVQKAVIDTLGNDFFYDEDGNKRAYENAESGLVIEVDKKGIRESFNQDNYYSLPRDTKVLKLATVELIPQAIENGTVTRDNAPNYHDPADANKKFAYIEWETSVNGTPVRIELDIKKSPGKNKFWVHRVYIENAAGKSGGTTQSATSDYLTGGKKNNTTKKAESQEGKQSFSSRELTQAQRDSESTAKDLRDQFYLSASTAAISEKLGALYEQIAAELAKDASDMEALDEAVAKVAAEIDGQRASQQEIPRRRAQRPLRELEEKRSPHPDPLGESERCALREHRHARKSHRERAHRRAEPSADGRGEPAPGREFERARERRERRAAERREHQRRAVDDYREEHDESAHADHAERRLPDRLGEDHREPRPPRNLRACDRAGRFAAALTARGEGKVCRPEHKRGRELEQIQPYPERARPEERCADHLDDERRPRVVHDRREPLGLPLRKKPAPLQPRDRHHAHREAAHRSEDYRDERRGGQREESALPLAGREQIRRGLREQRRDHHKRKERRHDRRRAKPHRRRSARLKRRGENATYPRRQKKQSKHDRRRQSFRPFHRPSANYPKYRFIVLSRSALYVSEVLK